MSKQNMNIENLVACIVSNFFTEEDILNEHKENCIGINGEQAIKMPNKGVKK